MDKKLLDALNNLSYALEEITDALKTKDNKPKAATTEALQSGKLDKKIQLIDKGVKQLISDNKKILKNQETLIALSKKKPAEKDPMDKASDPQQKNKLKDGLASIMMIAVGVLAIGLAFKLIGQVNFLSVIALALALPLVAMAFEKIAKMKDLKAAQMKNLILITVAMSTAIVLSSYILGLVQPVGIFKLITAIFIAGMFAAIAFSIDKLVVGLRKIKMTDMKSIAMMPIVLVAVSVAIALSSYALQLVKPVGIFKLFTAIFIAAMFGAISFGLGKLVKAFTEMKVSPADAAKAAILMPILLVAVAAAITGSSWLLSMVKPVGIFKLFTAIFIAIAFIPIAFALPFISKAIEKVDVKKIALLPIVLIAMALTIWVTSLIFNQVEKVPFGKLFNIIFQAVTLAVIAVAMGLALRIVSKVPIKDAIKGGVVLVIIAAVVMITSQILALGSYKNYPPLGWVLGVGLSLVAFTLVAVVLGAIAMSGIGLGILAFGLPLILGVAATIVATSMILAQGKYDVKGILPWAIATALLYAAFVPILLVLGAVGIASAVMSFFGPDPWEKARGMMVQVAQTIVDVSFVLQKGSYKGGPTKEWAEGIAIALGAFSPVYSMLMKNSVMEVFGMGGVGPDDFNKAIRTVSEGIVYAAGLFANTSSFVNGPPKAWAEGVGGAIAAFSPVYVALNENSGWISSGPSPEEMKSAIMTISQGIVDAALFFGANSAAFDLSKVPSKEWGENVGSAIKAFMPALEYISKNSGIFSGDGSKTLLNGISNTSLGITKSSIILSRGKFDKTIPESWMKNVSSNVKMYVSLAQYLSDAGISTVSVIGTILGMSALADGYAKLADGVAKLGTELEKIDTEKLIALKNLTGSIVLMSLMDSDQFEKMMNALEDKAKVFVDVINQLDKGEKKEAGKGTKAAPSPQVKTATKTGQPAKTMNDLYSIMKQVDSRLASISESSDNISKYVDEIKSGDLNLKK
jgi:X-X-X-Leu-X-X-Gly heptad repeat protein